MIKKLEESSNTFRRDFDREMDRSSLNGTSAEDRYNDNVADYENALDDLRRKFDRSDSWWQSRGDVQEVIASARPVNQMINALPFRQRIESRWNNMRNDLNKLADTYDLPGLNGGGWTGGNGDWNGNNGNWNGSGQMGDVPSWAVGTFYGRGGNGEDVRLVIERGGRVTADIGGSVSYGTIYKSTLRINGAESRVTRLNNGISTQRMDNGLRIDYSKTYSGGGGWDGGQSGNVPSWATGTFYGRNPNGEYIQLTINRNGTAVANIDGRVTNGKVYGEQLNISGASSRITRIRDGIRTTTDYGLSIDYTRTNNGGWNPGNIGGGQKGDVSSWAVGTFYGTNPADGSRITLTITRDGSVTVNSNGNVDYGSVFRDRLTINGATANIERTRNGIRTTRPDNGLSIEYVKR